MFMEGNIIVCWINVEIFFHTSIFSCKIIIVNIPTSGTEQPMPVKDMPTQRHPFPYQLDKLITNYIWLDNLC